MSVPGIVQSALGDEQVAARVGLGGEDELYVTPSRILIYRGEGLLSDETVEEYAPHAERVVVKEGRRKGKIVLEHDLEGERSFSVPPSRLDDVLLPVLAGVLNAAGVTEPGETVKQAYRFSELTLIVTSRRLVKHIGTPVWDADYEEYQFANTTGLSFEQGSVATQIVLEVDGRRERIKAPNEEAPEVRAHLEEALFEFHEVSSMAEFDAAVEPDDADGSTDAGEANGADDVTFAGGVAPLDTGGDDGSTSDSGGASSTAPAGANAADGGANATTGGTGAAETSANAADAGASATDTGAADAGSGATDAGAAGTASGATDAGTTAGGEAIDELIAESGDAGAEADSAAAAGTDSAAPADVGSAVEEPSTESDEDPLDDDELTERLDDIARAVNKQNRLLERHQETIEQLIEELQRIQN